MKKTIQVALSILVIAVIGYFIYQNGQKEELVLQKELKTIKIGAILPLTGNIAFLGTPVKESLDLFVEENKEYFLTKGYILSVVYGDSKGNTKDAVSIVNKMIAQDKVNIVFPFLTNVCLAINPIVEKENIFTMALSVYPPVVENDVTIKIFYDFKTESEKLILYLKENSYKNILVVSSNDAASKYQYESYFTKDLDDNGINYEYAPFNVGEKNFKNLIPNNMSKYDAVLLNGFGSDFPQILNTLNTYDNLTTPVISGIGMYEIKRTTPFELVKNSVFSIPSFLLKNEKNYISFSKKYKEKFNHDNNSFMSIFAYDNLEVIKILITNENLNFNDGKSLKSEVISLKEINGLSGKILINEKGESQVEISIVNFEDGYVLKKK